MKRDADRARKQHVYTVQRRHASTVRNRHSRMALIRYVLMTRNRRPVDRAHGRHAITALAIALFLVAAPSEARAQDTVCIDAFTSEEPGRIGCVNNIRETRWLFFDKTVEVSDDAEIRRRSADAPVRVLKPIRATDPLSHRDLVRLNNRVDLELYLSDGRSRSRVVLERGGLWELRRDTVPRLMITHGQMVIEQFEGRLEAHLENVLNVIHATTVYYDVDSTAGESFVFLKDGHMSFPEYNIDVQGSDSLWILRAGSRPQAVAATEAMIRRWTGREDHANREMWRAAETPIVQRPKFWLLTGGLAAGAVLLDCAVTHVVCNGGDVTSGEYRIPIPE